MQFITVVVWPMTWIAGFLLLLAGVGKLRRPVASGDALALAGFPGSATTARLLGLAEVIVGLAVLGTAHQLAAAAVAVTYAGFAIVSWQLLRSGGGSCGCFGEVEAPMSRLHVATNLILSFAAMIAALAPTSPPSTLGELVLLLAAVALGATMLRMVLVLAPALADGIQRLASR